MKTKPWLLIFLFHLKISAALFYVDDVAVNGTGTFNHPFNNFSSALNVCMPGDTIIVMPGNYSIGGEISTVRSGLPGQPITLTAYDPINRPYVQRIGKNLKIQHSYLIVDGFIFDGQFGAQDVIDIRGGSHRVTIKNCEVMNGLKDGIDLHASDFVTIENCRIHHMLAGSYSNQQDAHGIVATGEKYLTIRGCEIYYVSGDCFQTDPNRGLPLWDEVLIENCKLWTGPLPADAAGWHAGEIPGENAIDTKINPDSVSTGYRPKLTLKNVEAYGFVPGYISNRAAFNIKEKVDCFMDKVKVYNNEIAFRIRGDTGKGSAYLTLTNIIAYENLKTFRTEDDVERLHIYNCTLTQSNGGVYFQNVSGGYDPSGFDLRNCLFMGSKPGDASHFSNLSADSGYFVNAANHDYHLSPNSPAIDAGVDIAEVVDDFEGNPRWARSYDVGAYESIPYTPVVQLASSVPREIFLYQNYPNPFNFSTKIRYESLQPSDVVCAIYDILGRQVVILFKGFQLSGQYEFVWYGKNKEGRPVNSGVYFCQLTVDGRPHQIKKMILVR
ncbi:MAG: hypothetical protein Kow0042_19790 [Calditrichia bacterium]